MHFNFTAKGLNIPRQLLPGIWSHRGQFFFFIVIIISIIIIIVIIIIIYYHLKLTEVKALQLEISTQH